MKNRKGFTLVELIATIAILGVISAIAVLTFNGVSKNTREKTYNALLDSIRVQAKNFYEDTGVEKFYVQTLLDYGYLTPDDNTGDIKSPKDNSKINCYTITKNDNNFEIDETPKDKCETEDGIVSTGLIQAQFNCKGGYYPFYLDKQTKWYKANKVCFKVSYPKDFNKNDIEKRYWGYRGDSTYVNYNDTFEVNFDGNEFSNKVFNDYLYVAFELKDQVKKLNISDFQFKNDLVLPSYKVKNKENCSSKKNIEITYKDEGSGLNKISFGKKGDTLEEELLGGQKEITIDYIVGNNIIYVVTIEDVAGNVFKDEITFRDVPPCEFVVTLDDNNATSTNHSTITTVKYLDTKLAHITKPSKTVTIHYINNTEATPSGGDTSAYYTLKGWYTSTDSSAAMVADTSSTPNLQANSGYTNSDKRWIKTGNATLYAQWNETLATLPYLSLDGYNCHWETEYPKGKTTEKNGGEKWNFTSAIERTFTAVCTPKPIRVYYNGNYTGTEGTIGGRFQPYGSWVSEDGKSKYFHSVSNGGSLDLWNPSGGTQWMLITKTGYSVQSGSEWRTYDKNCTFAQDYTSSNHATPYINFFNCFVQSEKFEPSGQNYLELNLYVNWVSNVTYRCDNNGNYQSKSGNKNWTTIGTCSTTCGSYGSCNKICGPGKKSRSCQYTHSGATSSASFTQSIDCNNRSCNNDDYNCKVRSEHLYTKSELLAHNGNSDYYNAKNGWTCDSGHTHYNAYIHYCCLKDEKGFTVLDRDHCKRRGEVSFNISNYICPSKPYSEDDGWIIKDLGL